MATSSPPPIQARNFFTWFCAGKSYLNDPAFSDAVMDHRVISRVAHDAQAAAKRYEQFQLEQTLRDRLPQIQAQTAQLSVNQPTFVGQLAVSILNLVLYPVQRRLEQLAQKDQAGRQGSRPGEGLLALPDVLASLAGKLLSYFFWRQPNDNASLSERRQRTLEDFPDRDLFTRRPVESSMGSSLNQQKR